MISKELIQEAKSLAYGNAKQFGAPAIFHIDFSAAKGIDIARKLSADEKIVSVGTLLMDCMLGPAMRDGKPQEHVEMSVKRADVLLDRFPDVEDQEKENILYCIREHHGVDAFYSRESEICCNADCYRFISVEGVLGGAMDFRDISVEDFVALFLDKAEEKWNALSLDICKKELEPQYEAIKIFLTRYKKTA